jgi:hypothetical protein
MFFNQRSLVLIGRDFVRTAKVDLAGEPKIEDLAEFDLGQKDLESVLSEVRQRYGSRVRVLLSEDLAYVACLFVSLESEDERKAVEEKAQEIIPESLTETVWDFKDIFTEKEQSKKIVQVVAAVKSFFEGFSLAASKAGLEPEAMEPVSCALASLTEEDKLPQMIIHKDKKILVLMAGRGLVLASETVENQLFNKEVANKLIEFCKTEFQVVPSKIICSGSIEEEQLKQVESLGYPVEKQNLEPMIGLAEKKDLKGKDEDVLNLTFQKIKVSRETEEKSEPVSPSKDNPEKSIETSFFFNPQLQDSPPVGKTPSQILSSSRRGGKRWWLVLGIVVLGLSLAGAAFYFWPKEAGKSPETENLLSPTPETDVASVSATPSSSTATPSEKEEKEETPLDLTKYKIKVLNGSGKVGEAARLSDFLKEKGYRVEELGNAENYDYEETVVQTKQGVEERYREKLDKDLENRYIIITGEQLEESSLADLVITVGQK